MSDAAISLTGIGKMYRVFAKKHWQMLDALGLPIPAGTAQEFWALRDVNVEIPPGQRVGIIGKNGAGKSTLLKIIAGLLRPTTGKLAVSGRVHALLELGTGFHPDFTGRENVVSSLAYLGITGKPALALSDGIIEFSELEQFIDRPFKTYSSGMQARLTFSVATSVQPEVMIVDEILGAGDAYFAAKAVARMVELTSRGCTLLFVSHDISAVQMMCERAIWVDRGVVLRDGDTLTVGKAYMASIRRQEELRLLAKSLRLRPGHIAATGTVDPAEPTLLGRLVVEDGRHPGRRHAVKTLTLGHAGDTVERLRVGGPRDSDAAERCHLIVANGYTEWSKPARRRDSDVRFFENVDGRYFHAPFSIKVPLALGRVEAFTVGIEHAASEGETVRVEIHDEKQYQLVGELTPSPQGEWVSQEFPLPSSLLETWTARLADPSRPSQPAPPDESVLDTPETVHTPMDEVVPAAAAGPDPLQDGPEAVIAETTAVDLFETAAAHPPESTSLDATGTEPAARSETTEVVEARADGSGVVGDGACEEMAGDKAVSADAATAAAARHSDVAVPALAASANMVLEDGVVAHFVEGDRYGSGAARIATIQLKGGPEQDSRRSQDSHRSMEQRVFTSGEAMSVVITWEALEPIAQCTVVVAIYGMEGRCATQVLSPQRRVGAGKFATRALFAPLRLGPGEYAVSIGIFRDLDLSHRFGTDPLDVHDRRYIIRVVPEIGTNVDFGAFRHEVTWQMHEVAGEEVVGA